MLMDQSHEPYIDSLEVEEGTLKPNARTTIHGSPKTVNLPSKSREVAVPTHLVFLNHVVRVDTLNQVFGIRTILSAFLPQQNRDYKRQHGSNQVVFL